MAENVLTGSIFAARLALLVLLYGFVGLIAWLIWRDLAQERRPAAHTPESPHLIVASSETDDLLEGQTFPLTPVTTLGRDLSNDVVIPDSYVSGAHARIERRNDRWWVEDLGATNATQLNGQPLRPNSSTPLDPGDVLRIGRAEFKVRT